MGRHHNRVELVLRVNTFLRTHFFIPLNSCLNPMLVLRLKKTMNCYRGSTCSTEELTFSKNGLSLSDIVLFMSKPGCSSRAQSSWLVSITLPSFVTALLMMIRIIRSLVVVFSSIFLQRMRGSSILQTRRIVCTFPSSLMKSSPVWVVLFKTSSGQEATIMLIVQLGFSTTLISFLQSLVPSRSKKYPEVMARFESSRFRKATEELLRGRDIYPYCPGKIVPRFS